MIPGLNQDDRLDPELLGMIKNIFEREALEEAVAVEERMAEIGQFNRRDTYALEGVGEVVYRFDTQHLFMNATLQGASPRDPEFKAWLAKREDYARVRSRGTRIQSGFRCSELGPSRPKFRKVYADAPAATA